MQDCQKMLVQTHTPGSNEMLSNVENRRSIDGTSEMSEILCRRPLQKDNEVELNNVDRFVLGWRSASPTKSKLLQDRWRMPNLFQIEEARLRRSVFSERPSAAPDVPP